VGVTDDRGDEGKKRLPFRMEKKEGRGENLRKGGFFWKWKSRGDNQGMRKV